MISPFQWDETKRLKTIEKHGIDFRDVITIFEGPHLIIPARSYRRLEWHNGGSVFHPPREYDAHHHRPKGPEK